MRFPAKLFVLLAVSLTATGADWYVAPGASGNGTSIGTPMSIYVALRDNFQINTIAPGDTIWLRGGNHLSSLSALHELQSRINGTLTQPIKIRAYPGEYPVILGWTNDLSNLKINGSYTWWYGIEFWNPYATHRSDLYLNKGIMLFGPGTKIINCVIHDVGNGIYADEGAEGSEVNGCVAWACGDLQQLGHEYYSHSGGAGILWKDNIALNGFGWGFHFYTEAGAPLSNLTAIGNVAANSDIYYPADWRANFEFAGATPLTNIVAAWNMGYQSPARQEQNLQMYVPGTLDVTNRSATISSNYFAGGRNTVGYWQDLTYSHNEFHAFTYYQTLWPSPLAGTYVWDNNTYSSAMSPEPFLYNNVGKTFADWKTATGFDGSSAFSALSPVATQVFVRANDYEAGRANIVVYNWANTDNVSVDLSAVMPVGSSYAIRDAANWFGTPVKTGTYAGGIVSIPMTGGTVATPLGAVAAATTGKAFRIFVLQSAPASSTLVRAKNLRIKNARIN